MANQSISDPSARPSDEFVPEVDRGPLMGMRKSRVVAGAVLAPALIAGFSAPNSCRIRCEMVSISLRAWAGLMPGFHVPNKSAMTTVLAFVLFIAVGELLEVNLPWGSALVTMGLAPAVGFMLPLEIERVK